MDDLIAFLAARLDEREHFAKIGRLAQKHRERLLREVEADRALLANFAEICQLDDDDTPQERAVRMAVSEVMRMLILDRARVYSDHPDYRPEWKP